MPLYTKHTSAPCWGVWKIEESSDELLAMLDQKESYLSYLANLKSEGRKCEWLAARVLLKELMGCEPSVAYSPNGAPYIPDSSIHISISHTKGYAAVLVTERNYAGIDIEYLSERVRKIRSRFLSPSEESFIDGKHEIEHLLLCWSGKETLFKMIGQNGVDFKEHICIQAFPYDSKGSFNITETRTHQNQTFEIQYWVANEFVLTRSE